MKYSETVIDSQYVKAPHPLLDGFHFDNCFFDNCSLGPAESPDERLFVRNIELVKCRQRACSLNNAAIEDSLINGLGREGRYPLFAWGAVYKHVTLKGKLSGMKLNQWVSPNASASTQAIWDTANRAYYQSVDWALDIKEAEFQGSLDIHSVPGRLIRRDPETQVLVRRDTLNQIDWRRLPWSNSGFDIAIEWFLNDGLYDDCVLIASKRAAGFKDDMKVIAMMRKEEVACSD
jgi:hypothetical protein